MAEWSGWDPGITRCHSEALVEEHVRMSPRGEVPTSRAVPAGLALAAVFGAVHAGFSLYWSMGGTWLVWSLGSNLQ